MRRGIISSRSSPLVAQLFLSIFRLLRFGLEMMLEEYPSQLVTYFPILHSFCGFHLMSFLPPQRPPATGTLHRIRGSGFPNNAASRALHRLHTYQIPPPPPTSQVFYVLQSTQLHSRARSLQTLTFIRGEWTWHLQVQHCASMRILTG